MRVIHVIGSIAKTQGGPSRSVPIQIASLVKLGVACDLVVQGEEASLTDEGRLLSAQGVRIIRVPRPSFASVLFPHADTVRLLGRLFLDYDLVHIHGIWLPLCHAAASAARQVGRPVITAPHGMLHPWAMGRKWLKKRIAWLVYQRRDLERSVLLQATASEEAEHIQRLGFRVPVAVVMHGIAFPMPGVSLRKRPHRQLLFLARIYPGKGLEDLLHALAILRRERAHEGWRLVVAGYGTGGYVKGLKELTSQLGLDDVVSFVGPVGGQKKWDLIGSSDVLVLPSHSENFGMVVAEALAAGVPVITTHGTPWSDLRRFRCGWWVPIGVKPLSDVLGKVVVMPRSTLARMGKRGRRFIRTHYSSDVLGRRMRGVYRWVLRGGPKPSCVRVVR